jgi:small subunit ribosomal protein S17
MAKAGQAAAGGAAGESTAAARSPRRTVVGTVISARMTKTIVVQTEHLVPHARYGKYQRRATTYKAHDEQGQAQLGDQVEIAFARRLSKTKHWRLVSVLRKGKAEAVRGDEDRERVATRPVQRPPAPAPAAASGGGAAPGATGAKGVSA